MILGECGDTCGDCHFYKGLPLQSAGECRHSPPQLIIGSTGFTTMYPVVPDNFPACGQFMLKVLLPTEGESSNGGDV